MHNRLKGMTGLGVSLKTSRLLRHHDLADAAHFEEVVHGLTYSSICGVEA